jgi:hypothetical protein
MVLILAIALHEEGSVPVSRFWNRYLRAAKNMAVFMLLPLPRRHSTQAA